jgi:hypothetical protein
MDKNIKLKDILEKLKNGEKLENCGIEVDRYLEIAAKSYIINGYVNEKGERESSGIINHCIKYIDGLAIVDYVSLEIVYVIDIILYYTNIEIGEVEAAYDKLKTSGIYKYVSDRIPEEDILLLEELLFKTLNQKIKNDNSFQNLSLQVLSTLIEKIPSERKLKNILKKNTRIRFK